MINCLWNPLTQRIFQVYTFSKSSSWYKWKLLWELCTAVICHHGYWTTLLILYKLNCIMYLWTIAHPGDFPYPCYQNLKQSPGILYRFYRTLLFAYIKWSIMPSAAMSSCRIYLHSFIILSFHRSLDNVCILKSYLSGYLTSALNDSSSI